MNERVPLGWLFPLRMVVGLGLVVQGWEKLRGGWMNGNELHDAVGGWLARKRTYSFFVPVIETAHAHPKIFGTLLTLGELLIGAALVLGFLNRPVAFLGFVLLASIALGAGQGFIGSAVLMAVACFIFVFTSPGRFLGVDQRLRGKLPGWIV